MKPFIERGLYVITDCQRLEFDEVLSRTSEILQAGVAAVQYRDKETPGKTRRKRAIELHDLCRRHQTPLIINDDMDTFMAAGAEGIHLGGEDMGCREVRRRLGKAAVIGVSCYNDFGRALQAQTDGADYVAFGAFFSTTSKDKTVPATTDLLRSGKTELVIPVAAIGGITPENCADLLEAGADLLAVISSVYLADDSAAVVRRFNELIQQY